MNTEKQEAFLCGGVENEIKIWTLPELDSPLVQSFIFSEATNYLSAVSPFTYSSHTVRLFTRDLLSRAHWIIYLIHPTECATDIRCKVNYQNNLLLSNTIQLESITFSIQRRKCLGTEPEYYNFHILHFETLSKKETHVSELYDIRLEIESHVNG